MNISDIAEMAGVSRATVSRFFNQGYLSEEKRVKIQKVIDETGYIPSASAQSLRTKKSNQVGVIVPKISSETISRIVSGITQKLSEKGYHVLLANAEDSVVKEEEYIRIFRNNNVDGIIFIAGVIGKNVLKEMKRTKQPFVIVGQRLDGYCCVYHDDFHAAMDVTKLLLKGRPKSIAMLMTNDNDKAVGLARRKGFERALEEMHYVEEQAIKRECAMSFAGGKEGMLSLLKRNPEVEAVFCATDTMAAGAVEAIIQAGKRIPEDIAVAGVGDNQLARVITPKLTTAHYYYEESGMEAVEMLLKLLDGEEKRVTQLMLGYEVQRRQTA